MAKSGWLQTRSCYIFSSNRRLIYLDYRRYVLEITGFCVVGRAGDGLRRLRLEKVTREL